jgi:hypothetical protein
MTKLTDNQITETIESIKEMTMFNYDFRNLNSNVWDNKDVALTAISEGFLCFNYISDRLKSDKDFALEVLSYNAWYLEYFNKNIKSDFDCVFLAVKQEPLSLYYADKKYHADPVLLECLIDYFKDCPWSNEYGKELVDFQEKSMQNLNALNEAKLLNESFKDIKKSPKNIKF